MKRAHSRVEEERTDSTCREAACNKSNTPFIYFYIKRRGHFFVSVQSLWELQLVPHVCSGQLKLNTVQMSPNSNRSMSRCHFYKPDVHVSSAFIWRRLKSSTDLPRSEDLPQSCQRNVCTDRASENSCSSGVRFISEAEEDGAVSGLWRSTASSGQASRFLDIKSYKLDSSCSTHDGNALKDSISCF